MSSVYCDASWVVEKVNARRAGLKTVVFQLLPEARPDCKDRLKKVYALACEALKFHKVLDQVLEDVELESTALRIVMLYDLLIGKKTIASGGHEKKELVAVEDEIKAAFAKQMEGKSSPIELLPTSMQDFSSNLPKYLRVNTLRTSVEKVIAIFKSEGYELNGTDGKHFKKDEHIPDLLVFPPDVDFHAHELVVSGQAVLQDKASCMPAFALTQGIDGKHWHFIDSCAAPGNKTTHLAMLAGRSAKIDAYERDIRRCKVLKERVRQCGAVHIIRCHQNDFLKVDPLDHPEVLGALVDPSCSGSGLGHRLDHALNEDKNMDKVKKLAAFQVRIVKQALSYPSVNRVVYSTCSVHAEENEEVVAAVLPFAQAKGLDLVRCIPDWPDRGEASKSLDQPLADLCVRCSGETTHGFFVALFERKKPNAPVEKVVATKRKPDQPPSGSWALAKGSKKKKKKN